MSDPKEKVKNATRRHRDELAVKKQVKIAKQRGTFGNSDRIIKEPHRLAKRHAMDCGNPECFMCGNPRRSKLSKTKDKLTAQEQRLFQDVEVARDKRSNGKLPDQEE